MKLIGVLTPAKATLQGTLSAKRNTGGGTSYTGSYTARSLVDEAYLLPTADRYLSQNITVEKIPYYETTNLADGLTVYIGKEIEVNYG